MKGTVLIVGECPPTQMERYLILTASLVSVASNAQSNPKNGNGPSNQSLVASSAADLTVQTSDSNMMLTISGKAAEAIYNSLNVKEDKSGSDEQGAPKAQKEGQSILCSQRSAAKFVCIQYLDRTTGNATAE